jgi:hypothetical protein
MNYENDMYIDEQSLDVEWLNQPSLVIQYARISAQAELDMDQAKEKLDLVKAELDNEIRTNPEKFEIAKITEAVVTNTILTQKKYKVAMEEFLQAKFEAKVAIGASRAVDHRKSALENLVKLHGQQYFAGPMIPRDLSQERKNKEEKDKKVSAGIAQRMRRNKE